MTDPIHPNPILPSVSEAISKTEIKPEEQGDLQGIKVSSNFKNVNPKIKDITKKMLHNLKIHSKKKSTFKAMIKNFSLTELIKKIGRQLFTPVGWKIEIPYYRKLDAGQVDAKIEEIRSALQELDLDLLNILNIGKGKSFPDKHKKDLVDLIKLYFDSEKNVRFARKIQEKNYPAEVLERFNELDLEQLHVLKKNYNEYKENYQITLHKCLNDYHAIFKEKYPEEVNYNIVSREVTLTQEQLEFAKKIALDKFPQLLKFGWSEKLELCNTSLIQAIVVGKQMTYSTKLYQENQAIHVLLPKSPMAFILRESKKPVSEQIKIPSQESFGVKTITSKYRKLKSFKQEIINALSDFFMDAIQRESFTIRVGDNTMAAMGYRKGKHFAQMVREGFLKEFKERPLDILRASEEIKKSPFFEKLKEAYFEENANRENVSDVECIKEIFAEAIATTRNTHYEHGERIAVELDEFNALVEEVARNSDLNLTPEQIQNIQTYLRIKILEMCSIIYQSSVQPLQNKVYQAVRQNDINVLAKSISNEFAFTRLEDAQITSQFEVTAVGDDIREKRARLQRSSERGEPKQLTVQEADLLLGEFYQEEVKFGRVTSELIAPQFTHSAKEGSQIPTLTVKNLKVNWRTPPAYVEILVKGLSSQE